MKFSTLRRLAIVPLLALGLAACGEDEKASQAEKQEAVKPKQLVIDDSNRQAIEEIVKSYLLDNPEVFVEAMRNVERYERKMAGERQLNQIVKARDALVASKYDYVKNPEAKVHLVEFFDYQCGYCKRVFPSIIKLQAEFKDVRYIYKEFPILGPVSQYAAEAAIAAKKQGKYEELHIALMGFKGKLSEKKILQIAEKTGLDVARLEKDMGHPQVIAEIKSNLVLARSLGINGTPTFLIGDELVQGAPPYRRLVSLIKKAREECKTC